MVTERTTTHESLRGSWQGHPWLRAGTLDSLAEINEQCLELLCEQSATANAEAHPLLVQLGDLWAALDPAARRRAAGCPYLLVDGAFADPHRWNWACGHRIEDQEPPTTSAFFTVVRTAAVAQLVLTYAWHLARSQAPAARLLLGMSPACADIIAGCTLRQVTALAQRHPQWLQPRWPGRLQVWRELLMSAIAGESAALEHARLRGLQLLAAEVIGPATP